MKPEEHLDSILKNAVIGKFGGWRLNGKSYDAEGKQIEEKHEEDCFCCRKNILSTKDKQQ